MEQVYTNIQTKEVLDIGRIRTLEGNAMLKVKPELWETWDFEKNNDLDIYKMTKGTGKKAWWVCACNNKLHKTISHVTRRGLSCPLCKDGISFGEKVMYYLLKDNNITFKYDSSTNFSQNKRYDFILSEYNMIIEIQGEHHSKERTGYFNDSNKSLNGEIENDNFKKNLAIDNGIVYYYTIDIFDRDIDMMSKNIIECGLLDVLKIKSVDWKEISLKSQKSMVLNACEFYEVNEYSTGMIADYYGISVQTAIKYLKIGNRLGICSYTPNDSRSKQLVKTRKSKRVVQFDLDGNYITTHPSVKDAAITIGKPNLSSSISACCREVFPSSNGYMWRYYSEIGEVTSIPPYRRKDNVFIVQLTIDGEFVKLHSTMTEARKETGANNIAKVCSGEYSQCNGFKWMYKEDYEKLIKNK